MSIQSRIGAFGHNTEPLIDRPPEPPADDELEDLIAPDWAYDFPVDSVNGIHELRQQIRDAEYADEPAQAYSYVLGDHMTMGNKKVADEVAIFNAGGAANDCIHLGEDECQVEKEDCYAYRGENLYKTPLDARRRERIIYTHLDAATFARAFRYWYGRKRNEVTALRVDESGDFRSRHDLLKMDEIARRLSDIVDTYIYSASYELPWELVENYAVNRSNDIREFGDRRFCVVDSVDEIPEGGIRCPHDLSDGDVKCGECRLCIDESEVGDIYVVNFYSDDA
jgi:hypothetical protein